MTNQQAEAKAKKRWGKKFAVRNGGHFTSPDRRDKALQTILAARADIKRIDEEIARRLQESDWYQEFLKQKREHLAAIRKVEGEAHHYRFDVGRIGGVAGFQFFEVLGSGDTWEQAFEQADKRTQAA